MGTAATEGRKAVYSANLGAELIICQCGWTAEAEAEFGIEAIIAGTIDPDRYWIATQDGRGMIAAWHEGESAEAIYYERWSADGSGAHGWIDAESRRITQAG